MILNDKIFVRFVLVFAGVFAICHYGTLFMTGIAVPGGSYSPFIDTHLDVTAWVRSLLIYSTKFILGIMGIGTFRESEYVLRATSGRGIRLVYGCLGYGVMSFWTAYMAATSAVLKKKIWWFFGGMLLIYIINVLRLSLVLLSEVNGWRFPFGWDHHTWFNITSYLFIFLLIYFYHRFTDKDIPVI
ncbi:MAG: hypothetical protein H7320_09055 [Ferruginibacter sp.]|nr:hypothetical protein [Ferruginibacter sp.]